MFRYHLLYLSSEQLHACQWQRGQLLPGPRFDNDSAGVDAFIDYLAAAPQAPIYLLCDLIEEDFQRQSLPHVGGRAGRHLRLRRLQQLYRETPLVQATVQGRDSGGRRDDQVLLSALTNPALLTPWLDALELLKAPLAGIYSSALLGPALLARLGLHEEHLLLVSQQSGGLRQSYFRAGQLKFSRLTPDYDRDGVAISVAGEAAKTQQFLTSIRLTGRGDLLHTVIVAPSRQIAALEPLCRDNAETAFRFLAMEDAAAALKLDGPPSLADDLLLHMLGSARPPSHYPAGALRRYYQLWRARLSLFSASAALLAGALLWSGVNLWTYNVASNNGARLNREAVQFQQRYRAAMEELPPAPAPTANMKAAVKVGQMLAGQAPTPQPLLVMLSGVLEQMPQIRLIQLDWHAGAEPASAAPLAGTSEDAVALPALTLGIPQRPLQQMRVTAEVQAAQDDYRTVMLGMNQFAQQLARQPKLSVSIVEAPLDIRSSAKLNGKAGGSQADSRTAFTLNLVLNP